VGLLHGLVKKFPV